MTTLKVTAPEGMWVDSGLELVVSKDQMRRREGMLKVLKKDGSGGGYVETLERVVFKNGEEIGYEGPQTPYIKKQCGIIAEVKQKVDAGAQKKADAEAKKKADAEARKNASGKGNSN